MAQLYWPFEPSRINYGYGYPPGYGGYHNGIDFGVSQGTELRATASGTVRNVDAGTVDGAGVDIITADGWKVRMWHVSAFLVPNDSQIEAGQVVALSGGARGTWGAGNSTGAHLHWGVALDGRNGWVDPAGLNPQNFDEPPKPKKEDYKMYARISFENGAQFVWNMATGERGHINSNPDNARIGDSMPTYNFLDEADFQTFANKYPFLLPKTDLSNVTINVDAIAQAIVDKLGNIGNDVTTKQDILTAIEANYPENA